MTAYLSTFVSRTPQYCVWASSCARQVRWISFRERPSCGSMSALCCCILPAYQPPLFCSLLLWLPLRCEQLSSAAEFVEVHRSRRDPTSSDESPSLVLSFEKRPFPCASGRFLMSLRPVQSQIIRCEGRHGTSTVCFSRRTPRSPAVLDARLPIEI